MVLQLQRSSISQPRQPLLPINVNITVKRNTLIMNHFAEMVEPRCPWGFIEMAGKCVYFSQKHEAASWSDAKQACEQGTLGLGNLAVLRTKSDLHVMNALRNMYGKTILRSYCS